MSGPTDELKELGDTFDSLLARLESAFRSQRQFVANASHELRTPLTRQRALIQVALSDPQPTVDSLRAAHERVLAANDEQQRLIEALLTLARSEGGLERREPTDLFEAARQVVLARSAEADQRNLTVTTSLSPAPTRGDPRLLERLAANLVDNALRHNVLAGRIDVMTGVADGNAVLSVTNTGPIVPAAEIHRLLQPFQRLGASRTRQDGGVGLGLSIVQAIATAHDASVVVTNQEEGGLRVTVSFPLPRTTRGGSIGLR